MSDKIYHIVLVIEDGSTLQSSDLFIDDLKGAQKLFIEKIKCEDPSIDKDTLNDALDEGWYSIGNTLIMYTEPFSIYGKE